jgi:parallel beta-helix repeat protein
MKVENLDLSNASIGVQLRSTDDSEISGNNITNNVGGVTVHYSWNNILSENSIANNAWGIEFLFSSLNVVCHNNFINNGVHVSSRSGSLNLVWSYGYPSGGNYWSDYTGVDLDHDGIGDTGYVIIGDEIDHYPLMGRFSDFNATSEHHVQTLCNSSITDFHFNGTAISFYVSGGNGTTGFCRICIPAALMNGTYRVFVNETEVSCNLLPCSDSTHKYLYFNYTHSTQEVVIVPEFPSFLIQPLFIIATLLAVIVHKRKHTLVRDRR